LFKQLRRIYRAIQSDNKALYQLFWEIGERRFHTTMPKATAAVSEWLTRKRLIDAKLKAAGWRIVSFAPDRPLEDETTSPTTLN